MALSLQELLAQKKAKETLATEHKEEQTIIAEKDLAMANKTLPEPVKKEEPAVAVPKVMSFAEKMALKKKEEEAAKQIIPPATPVTQSEDQPAPTPVLDVGMTQPSTIVASVAQKENSVEEKLRTGMLDASLDKNPMPLPDKPAPEDSADPAIAQAYADIKERLERLAEMSETDLPNAMSNLKKALMANPAAVSLMEDSDIGKMAVALRRITGESIAEAAKEKKAGRKPKDKTVDLTNPDVVAQVFAEL